MDFHRGPGGAPMDPEGGVRPRLGLLVQRRLLSLHDRGFCTPDELDRRAVDMLAELPEEDALATLNEFENADRQSLKNINGFLVSIIQKYRRVPPVGGVAALGAGPVGFNAASLPPPPPTMPADLMYGFGDVEYVPEMPIQYVKHMQALQQQQSQQHQHHPRRAFGEKPPPVALVHVPPSERMLNEYGFSPPMQEILESLLAMKKINIAELDNRFVTELKNMPETTALAALHEFSQLDTSRVRNVPGYIIGISKKVGPTKRDDYDPFDAASKGDVAFAPPAAASAMSGGPPGGHYGSAPSAPPMAAAYPVKRSRFDAPGGEAPYQQQQGPPPSSSSYHHHQQQQPAPAAFPDFGGPGGMGGGDLRDRIEREIERFIRSGQLIPEDIDEATRDFLAQQPPGIALRAVSDFAAKDLRKVQNKIGFIRGMVKKMIEREREAADGVPSAGGPPMSMHNMGMSMPMPGGPSPAPGASMGGGGGYNPHYAAGGKPNMRPRDRY